MASSEAEVSSTKYDIVVFGATGFTGQYVVEEIAKTIDEESGLTWAIAGRSMKKLQDVLAKAGSKTGLNFIKSQAEFIRIKLYRFLKVLNSYEKSIERIPVNDRTRPQTR